MSASRPAKCPVRIDGLRRSVADLRRSVDFYRGALGFAPAAMGAQAMAKTTRLQLGEQHIDLTVPDDPADVLPWANAPDPRFQHAAVVTDDMEAAWRRLDAYGAVAISRDGPQRLPSNTGGVTAFKFRDPDGHPLELIEFPAGVGDRRWQAGRARGSTLGIDHFALVVESIEKSVGFFAVFGFGVQRSTVNCGAEQDRLDGLEDVIVDVVSLESRRGPQTPHLELLRYRRPAFTGRLDGATAESKTRGGDEIVWIGEPTQGADESPLRVHDADGHCFVIEASTLPS